MRVSSSGEIAAASWRDHGAVITVKKLETAMELANRIAPEHIDQGCTTLDAHAPDTHTRRRTSSCDQAG